jgi:XTP/dITP diphosphohydrolase
MLIVATRNPHKLAELQSLLAPVAAPIISVSEFADIPEVVEDRDTLEGNALKKAEETAQRLRERSAPRPFIVLADDSGLEVDALGGAPGVFSARFAEYEGAFPNRNGGTGVPPVNSSLPKSTRKVTYHDNNEKLLRLLRDVPDDKRTARFRCVIALATSDGRKEIVEGVCEGKIIREERGAQGFGYDPLFVPDGYDKTYAELGNEIKDRISHRGRAIEGVKGMLKSLI